MQDVVGTSRSILGMEINYDPLDPDVGVVAVYFRISRNAIEETLDYDEPDVFIDVDKDGRIVGVEMINPGGVQLRKCLKAVARRFKSKSLERWAMKRGKELEALVA